MIFNNNGNGNGPPGQPPKPTPAQQFMRALSQAFAQPSRRLGAVNGTRRPCNCNGKRRGQR